MAEECKYYYYDSGYSCALKREKEGNSSIDSDTVYKYCWGYHYDDCPRYKAGQSSGGGCFITSACTESRGLSDDCSELTILRQFRDGYMKELPTGQADICEYYHIAPIIVESIRKQSNSHQIFDRIYEELVAPCVLLIQSGYNQAAYILYRAKVKEYQNKYWEA